MGLERAYAGYRSFEYLEPDVDYRAFELCEGHRVFPRHLIPLRDEEEARVKELAETLTLVSLHEHPVLFPKHVEQDIFAYNRQGRMFTAYEALAHSYWDCVFDNMMDGMCTIHSATGWKWESIIHDIGMRSSDLAHQDFIVRAERVVDIERARSEGKLALVYAIEGAAPIENDVDRVDILYGLGIRMMGITYSESNALGSGLKERCDGGLTYFGKQVVERMNKIGMAVDCSHAGIRTSLDVIDHSKKPIFMSHIGAKALWNSKRLAPDKVLQACADKGGVIGIEAAPHTTITYKTTEHSIDSCMEHFEYVKDLVGIDHVAFGPDTLYGDHVALHHALVAQLSTRGMHGDTDLFDEVPYVRGIENPTEGSRNILRYLVMKGYSDTEIEKVMGGNILRVLNEVWYS
jgi:membrane dipeptidase